MVTKTDMLKLEPSKREEATVSDAMTRQLVIAYPEEDLFSALTRMMTKGVGRLPVVSHDNREAMIGIIARTDIAKAIESHRFRQDSAGEQDH
jgi:CIC family chloride channel protein